MALGAFLVSLIPYRVQKDEETGVVEIRSLLWACRKTPPKEGEEKGNTDYSFTGIVSPKGTQIQGAFRRFFFWVFSKTVNRVKMVLTDTVNDEREIP